MKKNLLLGIVLTRHYLNLTKQPKKKVNFLNKVNKSSVAEESKDLTEKTHKKLKARELDLGYKLLLESIEPETLNEI